jgi:hypothetical protein
MQVHAVRDLLRHDVDPTVRHRQLAPAQVQLERIHERFHMTVQVSFQPCKRR